MSLFSQLLFDTSALVDLNKLGLLGVCVGAVEEPCTLDLIPFAEMKYPVWEDVEPFGMRSLELTSEQMAEAYALRRGPPSISICDAGLIVLAEEHSIPIFAEDEKMVVVMNRKGVQHVSLLEMVDWLADTGKIPREKVVSVFQRISTELKRGCEKNYPEIAEKLRKKYGEW